MSRGTRGLVTMFEVSTGSVGESSAPSSNDSVHVSPINRCAATATMPGGERHRDSELAQRQMPRALQHLPLHLQAVAKEDHDQSDER